MMSDVKEIHRTLFIIKIENIILVSKVIFFHYFKKLVTGKMNTRYYEYLLLALKY